MKLDAYICRTGRTIAPWGTELGDLPAGDTDLRGWQTDALRRAGFRVHWVEDWDEVPAGQPCLLTYDYVFFSAHLIRAFRRAFQRERRPIQLALPAGSQYLASFGHLSDHRVTGDAACFDVFLLPDRAALEAATPLVAPFREHLIRFPVPAAIIGVKEWVHPVTFSVCLHVSHWLHVLQLGRLSVQIRWAEWLMRHPIRSLLRVARASVGRGPLLWRVLGKMNVYGRGVRVHPTACVEGAILGDGVEVGAMAIVRGSIIGAGTILEDRVNVAFSAVGPRNFVGKHSVVYGSVSAADANLCMRGMQMCLVGSRAGLTTRATPLDVQLGGPVRVRVGDRMVPVDLPALGACFGHDCYIGADVYIGPGRAIPNGVQIGPPSGRIVLRVPETLAPGAYAAVDGGLEPYAFRAGPKREEDGAS